MAARGNLGFLNGSRAWRRSLSVCLFVQRAAAVGGCLWVGRSGAWEVTWIAHGPSLPANAAHASNNMKHLAGSPSPTEDKVGHAVGVRRI